MTVVEKNDGSYLSAGEVSFQPGSFIDFYFISILFFVYAFVLRPHYQWFLDSLLWCFVFYHAFGFMYLDNIGKTMYFL